MKLSKRILALLLSGLMSASVLTACGKNEDILSNSEDFAAESVANNETSDSLTLDDLLSDFDNSSSIEKTVLVDINGLSIIADSLTFSEDIASLHFSINNESSRNYFIESAFGYVANSINGYMINEGRGRFFSFVKARGKDDEVFEFKIKELYEYGIRGIGEIKLFLRIEDRTDGYKTVFENYVSVKTSLYEAYKDSSPSLEYFATNEPLIKNVAISKEFYSKEKYLNEKDCNIETTLCLLEEQGREYYIEFHNNADYRMNIEIDDMSFKGNTIDRVAAGLYVFPHSKGTLKVGLEEIRSTLDYDRISYSDFEEAKSLTLGVTVKNLDNNETVIDNQKVEIPIDSN